MALLDQLNSTTAPQALGAGATFQGAWRDLTDYEELTVLITGDSGAPGTLYIELSIDKSTVDKTREIPVADIATFDPAFGDVNSNFARVRYVNGATPLTIFQCQTMLHEKKTIGPAGTEDKPSVITVGTNYRVDSFAGVGVSPPVDVSDKPVRSFSIQVAGVGGTPTAWSVELQTSLDGVNYSEIMTHDNLTYVSGEVLHSGANLAPTLYFRAEVKTLTLAPATSLTVGIIGLQ